MHCIRPHALRGEVRIAKTGKYEALNEWANVKDSVNGVGSSTTHTLFAYALRQFSTPRQINRENAYQCHFRSRLDPGLLLGHDAGMRAHHRKIKESSEEWRASLIPLVVLNFLQCEIQTKQEMEGSVNNLMSATSRCYEPNRGLILPITLNDTHLVRDPSWPWYLFDGE